MKEFLFEMGALPTGHNPISLRSSGHSKEQAWSNLKRIYPQYSKCTFKSCKEV